mmetsp:Transcript_23572/g.60064  ORF Transcript_23572/g.60064 Transcript_23572/m.60064 type:complete len:200 (+) Transcript_23572:299-898(+)
MNLSALLWVGPAAIGLPSRRPTSWSAGPGASLASVWAGIAPSSNVRSRWPWPSGLCSDGVSQQLRRTASSRYAASVPTRHAFWSVNQSITRPTAKARAKPKVTQRVPTAEARLRVVGALRAVLRCCQTACHPRVTRRCRSRAEPVCPWGLPVFPLGLWPAHLPGLPLLLLLPMPRFRPARVTLRIGLRLLHFVGAARPQ